MQDIFPELNVTGWTVVHSTDGNLHEPVIDQHRRSSAGTGSGRGDGHDTVLGALSERRSQTRLSDITVPYGKPHRGAVEPQHEVVAYLHQSHRSGRR